MCMSLLIAFLISQVKIMIMDVEKSQNFVSQGFSCTVLLLWPLFTGVSIPGENSGMHQRFWRIQTVYLRITYCSLLLFFVLVHKDPSDVQVILYRSSYCLKSHLNIVQIFMSQSKQQQNSSDLHKPSKQLQNKQWVILRQLVLVLTLISTVLETVTAALTATVTVALNFTRAVTAALTETASVALTDCHCSSNRDCHCSSKRLSL